MTTLFFTPGNKLPLSALPVINELVYFPQSKTDRSCKHLAGTWQYLGIKDVGMMTVVNFVKDGKHMSQTVDIFS